MAILGSILTLVIGICCTILYFALKHYIKERIQTEALKERTEIVEGVKRIFNYELEKLKSNLTVEAQTKILLTNDELKVIQDYIFALEKLYNLIQKWNVIFGYTNDPSNKKEVYSEFNEGIDNYHRYSSVIELFINESEFLNAKIRLNFSLIYRYSKILDIYNAITLREELKNLVDQEEISKNEKEVKKSKIHAETKKDVYLLHETLSEDMANINDFKKTIISFLSNYIKKYRK